MCIANQVRSEAVTNLEGLIGDCDQLLVYVGKILQSYVLYYKYLMHLIMPSLFVPTCPPLSSPPPHACSLFSHPGPCSGSTLSSGFPVRMPSKQALVLPPPLLPLEAVKLTRMRAQSRQNKKQRRGNRPISNHYR